MDEILRDKVAETLQDVFGVMFSLKVKPVKGLPTGKNSMKAGSSYFEARLDILRGDKFPAYFFFPEDFARNLAGNLAGSDSANPDDDAVSDLVKDAVYITLGGLLGKIDPEAKCGLGMPVARKIAGFSPSCLPRDDAVMGCETEFGYLWMDLGGIEKCC